MERVKQEVEEFLKEVRASKGGIEDHRRFGHWGRGIRTLVDVEKQEDVRKKIELFKAKMDQQMLERYGKELPQIGPK